jgi:hypothetical protein
MEGAIPWSDDLSPAAETPNATAHLPAGLGRLPAALQWAIVVCL